MMISKKFSETYKKNWIRYKYKICLTKQQRNFLIKCRSFDLIPPHIYNVKFILKDFRLNKKYFNAKKEFQWTLNLETKFRD